MRYWWVNHKQTSRQELDGSYLWSPRRAANGARNQFYENMRLAEPGDRVFSFSNAKVGHVGVVQDFAVPNHKPESFGSVGENWDREGWLLPVAWTPLSTPVRPKDHLDKFAPLLPEKYSPVNQNSGNGNQNAYLAEIGKPVFDLVLSFAGVKDELPLQPERGSRAIQEIVDDAVELEINKDRDLDSTTKQQLVLSRRGQGLFRSRVFDFEKSCRLTQVENPIFLVASHIKPWRLCASADERLDGANGLLLTAHADRLFDRGFISFGDEGDVIVSSRMDRLDLRRLGLEQACLGEGRQFHDRQKSYLGFHRLNVLLL